MHANDSTTARLPKLSPSAQGSGEHQRAWDITNSFNTSLVQRQPKPLGGIGSEEFSGFHLHVHHADILTTSTPSREAQSCWPSEFLQEGQQPEMHFAGFRL